MNVLNQLNGATIKSVEFARDNLRDCDDITLTLNDGRMVQVESMSVTIIPKPEPIVDEDKSNWGTIHCLLKGVSHVRNVTIDAPCGGITKATITFGNGRQLVYPPDTKNQDDEWKKDVLDAVHEGMEKYYGLTVTQANNLIMQVCRAINNIKNNRQVGGQESAAEIRKILKQDRS